MTGTAYFEPDIPAEGGEYTCAPAEADVSGLSQGLLLLRHAHYLGGIWNEQIVSYNLRVALVGKIASRYICSGVALVDLIREGNSGLDHALGNFEIEGGSRFSIYATRCIRQYIERAIVSRSGPGLT